MNYVGLYARNNAFLYNHLLASAYNSFKPEMVGLILWVDNDDHAVSHTFYEFRKKIRRLVDKGFDVKVCVNPRVADKATMEVWLQEQIPGHTLLLRYNPESEEMP